MSKISRLVHTIRYLKIIQIRSRLKFVYRRYFPIKINWEQDFMFSGQNITLSNSIIYPDSYNNGVFEFLNLKKDFNGSIDWDYLDYGRLWTYNLNYFEFLMQKDMERETGLCLIRDYINKKESLRIGYDPYPISLRNLFWIRFCIDHKINDSEINSFLFSTYKRLEKNLEYHLLGNHLLENGFSLLFGAYYFRNEHFYTLSKRILEIELNEQILKDGGHFELSPMYHQIMLYRLLDCINLVSNNPWKSDSLLLLMRGKSERMLGWLKTISFKDGSIPLLNDTANGIAPTSYDLLKYGKRLGMKAQILPLKESGYRKFEGDDYECVIDVGQIGPDYQPGHAHADTFNFVLNVKGKPVIVDTGCSTYEQGEIRSWERSSAAHNTVVLDNKNSSNVWASHRVGRRACALVLDETPEYLRAQHNGYRKDGIDVIRSFKKESENNLVISDCLKGNGASDVVAYFHLDKDITVFSVQERLVIIDGIELTFDGATRIKIEDYLQALEFNHCVPSKKIEVSFKQTLTTTIRVK